MLGLTVQDLRKDFPRPREAPLRVLDGVSLDVPPGGFTCLLGPSGSGKSVTLHILGGLLEASSGRIAFRDAVGRERAPRLGFVFQTPRLLPWRSVGQNIGIVLRAAGVEANEAERRIRDVLDLMGLADFRNAWPHQISGGMQQRVAIARALAIEPDVLLMDEPFSHLDEITARVMRAELVALWRQRGTTVLFVTHDIAEACFLGQRVVLLTPKPTRVHAEIALETAHPRRYGSAAMFDTERRVLEAFEASIDGALSARQRARLAAE